VHLGAREYDPSIGRFLSADPVMDIGDPQAWQGYAYATTLRSPAAIPMDCECAWRCAAEPTTSSS
jgi:hypothetical protein